MPFLKVRNHKNYKSVPCPPGVKEKHQVEVFFLLSIELIAELDDFEAGLGELLVTMEKGLVCSENRVENQRRVPRIS